MPDWPFGKLRIFGYDLIVVDAPWPTTRAAHEFQARKPRHPMSIADINRLPVGELARRDCLLFSWATPQLLDIQIEAMHRWGFTYISKIEWGLYGDFEIPRSRRPKEKFRVKTRTECVLVGIMGEPEHDTLPGIIHGGDRRYPRKPHSFYHMIDTYCPALTFRADVFTMNGNKKWDNWRPETPDHRQGDDQADEQQMELA